MGEGVQGGAGEDGGGKKELLYYDTCWRGELITWMNELLCERAEVRREVGVRPLHSLILWGKN